MRTYLIAALLSPAVILSGTGNYKHLVLISDGTVPTFSYATADGELGVEGDIETDADLYVGDDATIDGDLAVTGNVAVTAAITATYPALFLDTIRFCGNGNDGSTAHYIGPVPFDDTEADFITGGAGCDGMDNATIGNVDDAWPSGVYTAFKPVGMVCSGICTGATAANDAIVFALYDDTAAVAGMTCTFTFAGDATVNQCTVTDTTPATVAAGSLLAIKVSGTNDVCDDAGDDFECRLFITY